MKKSKKKKSKGASDSTIAVNRKARHNYALGETYVAGLELLGWEVKSLRSGKGQVSDCYVVIKNGEAWLLNSVINPVNTISTHVKIEESRTRKLLLHRKEIDKLTGYVEQKGNTLVALKLFWMKNRVKLEFAVAKGKKDYDKRSDQKDHDWKRSQDRLHSQRKL